MNPHAHKIQRLARLLATSGALVVVAALAGCGGGGGGGSEEGPTVAQLYAQQLSPNPTQNPLEGIDPDSQPESAQDAWVTIRPLSAGNFRLTVINTSAVGFINQFSWSPPPGMTITRIKSSSTGVCRLQGQRIACSATLDPPKCTCRPGGRITVDFQGHAKLAKAHVNYGVVHSYVELEALTPVPYKIPSYLGAKPPEEDLPICSAGQLSTKNHPCIHQN
jgi:hypothetical protein